MPPLSIPHLYILLQAAMKNTWYFPIGGGGVTDSNVIVLVIGNWLLMCPVFSSILFQSEQKYKLSVRL